MRINGIDTKDITFVVQGAIDKQHTGRCLRSIRKNFQDSTIVLSTWENSDVSGLDYDKVVFSVDPGASVYDLNMQYNNINRQIVTTIAGLRLVTTTYVAKVRNDLIFESPSFLQYFNKFDRYEDKYRRVKSRMIIMSMYTRINHFNFQHLVLANYNISDWFFFGYTDDVNKYWSIDLIQDLPQFSRYYLEHEEEHQKAPFVSLIAQNTPEQYFGSHFFGYDYKKETIVSLSEYRFEDYIKNLVNNFIVLDYEHSKIYSSKWEDRSRNEWNGLDKLSIMFYGEFLKYYKKYCDNSFVIPQRIDRKVYKRKISGLKDILWGDKVKSYRYLILDRIRIKLGVLKRFLRVISPTYRVSAGIREWLFNYESVQNERFAQIISCQKQIESKQRHILHRIASLEARQSKSNNFDSKSRSGANKVE